MAAMEKNNKTLNVPNLRFPEFSGEWERTRFERVVSLQRGSSPRPIIEYITKSSEGVNWVKIGDMPKYGRVVTSTEEKITKEGAKKSRHVNVGDLILSNSMSYGQPYIMNIEGYIHDGWFVLKSFENSFDRDYLCNLLISPAVQNQYRRLAAGGVVQNISSDLVNSVMVSLPSIKEQHKIASFLNLIDDRIATQRKVIEKYESLIRGLYHSVFNNPSSILQLREVVSVVKGKQINGEELLEEGKYYVMNGGTEPSGYLDEYNTPANTISISEGGNSCGYVQYNTEPFWSGGHCYSLHQKDEGVNYQYLYHFLKYKERDIMALRIGSGLPNVQKKDLERFEIRVLPIEQQNRVAEILEDISAKCDLEKKILQEWQWQKSFLLSNLFI